MANLVPYPGHGHATGQEMNVWLDTDADPGNVKALFDLIMQGPTNALKTALSAVAYGSEPGYDGAELWYMGTWHTSNSDNREHCTFRLFRELNIRDRGWVMSNVEAYHLYRDGTSRSWRY